MGGWMDGWIKLEERGWGCKDVDGEMFFSQSMMDFGRQSEK